MNKFLNFFTVSLFISLAIFISCSGGGGSTAVPPRDNQGGLLATGAAMFSSVQKDNVDVTGWDSFTLTFTYDSNIGGGTFTTTNVPSGSAIVWPASGTWVFGGPNKDVIAMAVRSDGATPPNMVTMSISALTAAGVTLAFDVVDPNGRLLSLSGNWRFVVTF